MKCFLSRNKNPESCCPFYGLVVESVRIISSDRTIIISDDLGNISPVAEDGIVRLPMGEFCLAANLFIEEMEHGCPLVKKYDYRAKQVSLVSWERYQSNYIGEYERLGITFLPNIFFTIFNCYEHPETAKGDKTSGSGA